MAKFNYPNSSEKCPYCGEKQKPCSEITSLSRAYARAACRKKYNGVPIDKLIEDGHPDTNPDL